MLAFIKAGKLLEALGDETGWDGCVTNSYLAVNNQTTIQHPAIYNYWMGLSKNSVVGCHRFRPICFWN